MDGDVGDGDGSYEHSLYKELELYVAPRMLSHVLWVVRRLAGGARDPQCRATWPEDPSPESGYAACQFRIDHPGMHVRPDGRRWEDGGALLKGGEVSEDFEEQAMYWLHDQMCVSNPYDAEFAAFIVAKLRETWGD